MIKNPVWCIMNNLFFEQKRMLGISIAVFSVSACGKTVAIIPMWDDHPANPMMAQASLPPQPDTLMSDPVKPLVPKKKLPEHHHDHH